MGGVTEGVAADMVELCSEPSMVLEREEERFRKNICGSMLASREVLSRAKGGDGADEDSEDARDGDGDKRENSEYVDASSFRASYMLLM